MQGGYIWIDSVCVDQTNYEEKKEQVRIMGKIFHNAEAVIGNLGHHNEASRMLFREVQRYSERNDSKHCSAAVDSLLADSLVSFSQRPYWTRLWIVQECIAARHLYMLCGQDIIYFNDFERATRDEPYEKFWKGAPWLTQTSIAEIIQSRRSSSSRLPFEEAIQRFGRLRCQDERDHIYALLYLIEWNEPNVPPLQPDYSLTNESLAMSAFRHCATIAGIRAVRDSLKLRLQADDIAEACFKCCQTLSDLLVIKDKLGIQSIDSEQIVKAAIACCSTPEEIVTVCQWFSSKIDNEQRLVLLRASAPLWSNIRSAAHLIRVLGEAWSSATTEIDAKGSSNELPGFHYEQRAEIFLCALPCVESNDDLKVLLKYLRVPDIDSALAHRVLAKCSHEDGQQVDGNTRSIDVPQAWTASHHGKMLGILLSKLCRSVKIEDRIRLAYIYTSCNLNVSDIAIVLRTMGIAATYSPEAALRAILREHAVHVQRIVVFLAAMVQRTDFSMSTGTVPHDCRRKLWTRHETTAVESQSLMRDVGSSVQQRREAAWTLDAFERSYPPTLCNSMCLRLRLDLRGAHNQELTVINFRDDWSIGSLHRFGGVSIAIQTTRREGYGFGVLVADRIAALAGFSGGVWVFAKPSMSTVSLFVSTDDLDVFIHELRRLYCRKAKATHQHPGEKTWCVVRSADTVDWRDLQDQVSVQGRKESDEAESDQGVVASANALDACTCRKLHKYPQTYLYW